ncbi:putative adenylyltransferase/sulfurtransferase MoeZ [Pirellulimonas nuda]|uniref:Putative adenylyltransferase/sulfurtransferase MoeZ n=1 Tax=Pirellulimonas nuda TaxID=2528009 RepID=A0A518DEK2_9BACT|nr:rhodanese-like domain-containing protein [Pirellulimonas nuda]QDU89897.1 putative adenylyltransferase/sulfurtransferase MoeZ [Pirellulimonas nuda]
MTELPLEISCRDGAEQHRSGDCLLVDCREPDEHALVTIDGATLLPMSEIAERVEELAPWKALPLLVYCHHGMRSAQTAQWLRDRGFSLAQSLAGGIDRWAVEIEPGMARY